MHKRGSDTAINPLIMLALGVVVLIILIVVFRDQITKGSRSYTNISDQAVLDDTKCSFVMGRSCINGDKCTTGSHVFQADINCGTGKICCQS